MGYLYPTLDVAVTQNFYLQNQIDIAILLGLCSNLLNFDLFILLVKKWSIFHLGLGVQKLCGNIYICFVYDKIETI